MELRAAEYYASIRKPEQEWRSIEDLTPQLTEFEHRVQGGDHDAACILLNWIDYEYLFRWGNYNWLLQLRKQLNGRLHDVLLQAMNQDGLGFVLLALGQIREAIALHEDSLALAEQIGDPQLVCQVLNHLGTAYRDLGEATRAIRLYEEALKIAQDLYFRDREGTILGNLGNAYHNLGDFEQAIGFYGQSLSIYRELGNRRREGAELSNLANTYRAMKQCHTALRHYETALAIAQEINDALSESETLGGLGVVYRELGQFESARDLSEKALAIARAISARRYEGLNLGRLGIINQCLGQYATAQAYYAQAHSIASEIEDVRYVRAWSHYLGTLYRALGDFDKAVVHHRQALPEGYEGEDRSGKGIHLLGLGKALLAQGQFAEARLCFEEAYTHNTAIRHQVRLMQGVTCLHIRHTACAEYFRTAVDHCREMLQAGDLYETHYTLAISLVGQAVCDPHWDDATQRADLLALALTEYRRALGITAAPGVVRDALRDLELIRAAGVEGVEPAFALLEQALKRDTPATKGGSDLSTV